MPARRTTIDPGIPTPALRPVAAPVDMYEVPNATGDQNLAQLGRALATISPQVRNFVGTLVEERDQNAQEEGRLAAERLREEGLTLAEGTRKGVIRPSANKFYMAGLREQLGRITADKYDGDLRAALAQDENLRTSTNLGDFDKSVQQFRQSWVKTNVGDQAGDKFFGTGFSFRVAAYENQQRSQFAAGIDNKIQTQGDEATFAEVYKHVSDNAGKLTPEQSAADINTLLDDLIVKQGRNPSMAMRTASQAIASAALDNPDNGLQMLEVLKHVKGKTGALIATAAGSKLYAEVKDQVNQSLWNQNQREAATASAEKKARVEKVLGAAITDLVANPNADLKQYVPMLRDDPSALSQLTSLAENANKINFKTDEAVKRSLFAGVWNGDVSRRDILRVLGRGKLTTEDASFLNQQVTAREERDNQNSPTNKVFKDFVFMHALEGLKGRFADSFGIVAGEAAERAAHAQATLIDQWLRKSTTGEIDKLSPAERVKWLTETSDAITAYERSGATFGSGGFSLGPPAPIGADKVPEPLDKRLPSKLVITREDITRVIQSGQLTPNLKAVMDKYRILPTEQGDFLRSQAGFLTKKTEKK